MKLGVKKWEKLEEKWIPFHKTKAYHNYLLKKRKSKKQKENDKEVIGMDVEVHNKLGINYSKTLNTISFFAKTHLGKFSKKNKWKLEIWLDEKNSKHSPTISCGMALMRPNKTTIYVKKAAGNLNKAVKQSVGVIEKAIRKENTKWRHEEPHLKIS